jgi:hypothetical protein
MKWKESFHQKVISIRKSVVVWLALILVSVQTKQYFYELVTTFKSPLDTVNGPSRVSYTKFGFSDPDILGAAVPNSFSLTIRANFEEGYSFQISFFTFSTVGLEWNFRYLGNKILNFPMSDRFGLHAAIPNTNYHFALSESGIVARVDLNSISSISEPVYTPLSKNCKFAILNSLQNGFIVGLMPIFVDYNTLSLVGTGFTGPEESVMRYVLMPDTKNVLMHGFGPNGQLLLKLDENNLATKLQQISRSFQPGGLLYLQNFKLIVALNMGPKNEPLRMFSDILDSSTLQIICELKGYGYWESYPNQSALFFEEGRYIHLNNENTVFFRGTEYSYDPSTDPPISVKNVVRQNIKSSLYPGFVLKTLSDSQYVLRDQIFGSTFMLYRRRECDPNCATCEGDTTQSCTSCTDVNKWLAIGNGPTSTPSSCIECITPGMFKYIESYTGQKFCRNCHKYCLTCEDLTGICTSCNHNNGYYQYGPVMTTASCSDCSLSDLTLINTRCFDITSNVTILGNQNRYKLETVDISAVVQVTSKGSPTYRAEFMRLLTNTLRQSLVVKFTNLNGNVNEVVSPQINVNTAGTFMTIDIRLQEPFTGTSYRVRFTPDRNRGFVDQDIVYGLQAFEFDVGYTNTKEPASELSKFQTQGQLLSGAIAGLPIKNQAAIDTISFLVSLDPTGIVTRLSQTLKLLSKIYLLNINFGDRLTVFLEGIEEYFPLLKEPDQKLLVYHSLSSSGKISRKKGLGNILAKFHWKIILYYLSWLMMGWRYYMLNFFTQPETIKRRTFILLYLTPKIHFIVFNMVFMDFVFYGVRSGFQVWCWYSTFLALVSLSLFIMDLLYLYQLCQYETYWRFYAIWKCIKDPVQFIPVAEDKESNNRTNNDSFFDGSMIGDRTSNFVKHNFSFHSTGKSNNKQSGISGAVSKPSQLPGGKEREIDTAKTIRNIEANIDILESLTSPIMLTRSVCGSQACRTLRFFHYVRMSLFMMVIAGGQKISILSCLILLGIEVGRVCFIAGIITSKKRQKVRVFKNTILMFWEMSQSIFLSGFLILSLVMCKFKFDEQVPSTMQIGGIILIILSVLCEYILFASYLIFLIFEFFRKRKLLKQLKNPPTQVPFTWFIVDKLTPDEKKNSDHENSELEDLEDEPIDNNVRGRFLLLSKFQQPKQLENLQPRRPSEKIQPLVFQKNQMTFIKKNKEAILRNSIHDFGVKQPETDVTSGLHHSSIRATRKISDSSDFPQLLQSKHKNSGGTGSGDSDEKMYPSQKDKISGDHDDGIFDFSRGKKVATSAFRGLGESGVESTDVQIGLKNLGTSKPPPLKLPRKTSENLGIQVPRKQSLLRSPGLPKSPGIPTKLSIFKQKE